MCCTRWSSLALKQRTLPLTPPISLSQNITFKRAAVLNNGVLSGSIVGSYLHNNGSYGALVCLAPTAATPLPAGFAQLANNIAQHVVALDPDSTTVLGEQAYVFDGSRKVADMIRAESSALGVPAFVAGFVRFGGGKEVFATKQA